ncbi:MAG TPA: hypothetical protein VGD84_02260 [Pseudonocardiaceae bacterium]
MRALADKLRSIDPRIIGLLRRALMVLGFLLGFLVAGSALAHAAGGTPPPKPERGIELPVQPHRQLRLPPVLAPVTGTITSVATHAVDTVTKTAAPLTNAVTSVTTDLTTSAVRTIAPIVHPAVTMTTPVLGAVSPPPPVRLRPPVGSLATTTIPATDLDAPAATDSHAVAVPSPRSVVPPTSVTTVDRMSVLSPHSDESIFTPAPPRASRSTDDSGGPIADVGGTSCAGNTGPGGPTSGISRPTSGISPDLLSATRIRPGTGPPKWSFFDPYHHPS